MSVVRTDQRGRQTQRIRTELPPGALDGVLRRPIGPPPLSHVHLTYQTPPTLPLRELGARWACHKQG